MYKKQGDIDDVFHIEQGRYFYDKITIESGNTKVFSGKLDTCHPCFSLFLSFIISVFLFVTTLIMER